MHRLVKRYEYSNNEGFECSDRLSRLNSDLRLLQSWRRRTMSSLDKLNVVLRFLNFHRTSGSPGESLDGLLEDYRHIARKVEMYGYRLEHTLSVVTSFVQIDDSQRGFAETINVSRLITLVLIFVPLKYISCLFSMGGEFAPGQSKFWMYFSVSMPLTAVVILIACSPARRFERYMGRQRIEEMSLQRSSRAVRMSWGQDDIGPAAAAA